MILSVGIRYHQIRSLMALHRALQRRVLPLVCRLLLQGHQHGYHGGVGDAALRLYAVVGNLYISARQDVVVRIRLSSGDVKGIGLPLVGKHHDLGSRHSGDGSVTFRVGPSPVYLTASSALLDPVHSRYLSAPPPGKVQALPDCLSDPASLKQFRDYSLYQIGGMPSRIPGTFELRAVEDPERGKVIEAELKGRENLPEIVNEYAVFRFKDPVPVESGDGLRGFGMWVKGNSSFGSVLFEFTDAKGRIWRSELSDNALITFDSWQFMGVSLDPSLDLLPRAAVKAGSSAKTPDFPIRITGFLLETAQHALNPCEMQKTDPKLRVSGLSLLY